MAVRASSARACTVALSIDGVTAGQQTLEPKVRPDVGRVRAAAKRIIGRDSARNGHEESRIQKPEAIVPIAGPKPQELMKWIVEILKTYDWHYRHLSKNIKKGVRSYDTRTKR